MAARAKVNIQQHIVATPGIAGGRPRIAGHRIRVQDVAIWHERLGMSPDEIASEYDLSLGDVYAELAYYFDHRAEIQRQVGRDRRFVAALKRQSRSLVQSKLNKQRG